MKGIPDRYNLENFKGAIINPEMFLNELSYNINRTFGKWRFHRRYGSGTNIMEEDWDNLIILDACRYDEFKEECDIGGDLNYKISKGSSSNEFYRENFSEGEVFYDTVYVTANPYGVAICEDTFHRMETTFSGNIKFHNSKPRVDKVTTPSGKTYLDRHVKNLQPEKVTALAKEMYNTHPDKRLLIHYMQPHKPYLGEYAEKLRKTLAKEENLIFDRFHTLDKIKKERESGNTVIRDLMNAASQGYISEEDLRRIYVENINIVLKHVEEVISEIEGKTVITADHGELLGEYRGGKQFDHPPGIYTEELRKVPWLVINQESRRETVTKKPTERTEVTEEELTKQLELLGYK